jgi:two-component system chemotaxis response regulator CheB
MRRGIGLIPAGHHVTFDSRRRFVLSEAPADELPSGGDRLFASAAVSTAGRVLGVVLTGLLNDGSEGARAIKSAGGRILAEDPATARAAAMPNNAIATGCVDYVLPLRTIPAALVALTMAPGGAELLAVPTPAWAQLGS